MRAIQTRYAGCHFRSRLEARWAVFFDTLGIEWWYEPEGFDLGEAGWYLPDFYLPEHKTWIEIKPTPPTDEDLQKTRALWAVMPYREYTNAEVYIFFGDIPYPYPKEPNIYTGYLVPIFDQDFAWMECALCGDVHIGMMNYTSCSKGCEDKLEHALLSGFYDLIGQPDKTFELDVISKLKRALHNTEYFGTGHKGEKLQLAYEATKSARFEGKRP